MAIFHVELRGATQIVGGTRVDAVTDIEAEDWTQARERMARRYGIDVFDPGMFAIDASVLPRAK